MIYLLNSNVVPSQLIVRVTEISKQKASELLIDQKIMSAIGHDATAEAFSSILGVRVEVNRITASPKPFDRAISLKLNGRIPEGTVLSLRELNEFGYTLYLLEYFSSDLVIVPPEFSNSSINY